VDETQKAVKAAMAQHAKIVVGDDREKQNRCMDEVKGVLAKYDCVLVPRAILSPGNAEFMIECRSRPKGQQLDDLKNPYAEELKTQATQADLPPPAPVLAEVEEPPLD